MGRFWARCKLGSDLKPRSIIHVMNLGLLGAAIYRAILIDQHSLRSHPNKAVDVVVCQTFQIALGFRAINLCLLPAVAPTRPLGCDGVFPAPARLVRYAAAAGVIVADMPGRSGCDTS